MDEMVPQYGVRYTRAVGNRYLVGTAQRLTGGKWSPRGLISERSPDASGAVELQGAPLFDSDHAAADYAIKAVARYSADHPEPLT